MVTFIDTNVSLTATDESRLHHRDAGRLLGESGIHGLHPAASGQVLREYLVVATRPLDANGLGLPVRDATANASEFLRCIRLHDQTEEVARRLHQLGLACGLHGKRLHDANIVATMSAHGLRALSTGPGGRGRLPARGSAIPGLTRVSLSGAGCQGIATRRAARFGFRRPVP